MSFNNPLSIPFKIVLFSPFALPSHLQDKFAENSTKNVEMFIGIEWNLSRIYIFLHIQWIYIYISIDMS